MADATQHIAAVERIYAAVGSGDLDAILGLLADDVDWAAEAAAGDAAWYGARHGKADVVAFFEGLAKDIDITEFTPVSYGANDDEVFVLVQWSFTGRRTGRRASMQMHHWWQFRDGLVVRFRGAE